MMPLWELSLLFFFSFLFLYGLAHPPNIVVSLISGGWCALHWREPYRPPPHLPSYCCPSPTAWEHSLLIRRILLHLLTWCSGIQQHRRDSVLMTAEANACSAASLYIKKAPSVSVGLPGVMQLHPGRCLLAALHRTNWLLLLANQSSDAIISE